MSTYIDPATALRLAHTARNDEIRRAEEHRLARGLTGRPEPPRPRRRQHLTLHWPHRVAHAG